MRPTRRDAAIEVVEDIAGDIWLVRERRVTPHGFDVLIGWPDRPGQQGATVVLTAGLAQYLIETERLRDIDLPIGRTAIKRLRATLDLRFDWDAWWAARSNDLSSLTLAAFAQRHNCSTGAASQRRAALKQQRPRQPEPAGP